MFKNTEKKIKLNNHMKLQVHNDNQTGPPEQPIPDKMPQWRKCFPWYFQAEVWAVMEPGEGPPQMILMAM